MPPPQVTPYRFPLESKITPPSGSYPSGAGLSIYVDFSQIAPVPGSEYESLLRRKVLQLLDRERVKFKIKLAAYLGA